MKVVQNLANVIGLVFGGILVSLGFGAFFIIFGLAIALILWWTLTKKEAISL